MRNCPPRWRSLSAGWPLVLSRRPRIFGRRGPAARGRPLEAGPGRLCCASRTAPGSALSAPGAASRWGFEAAARGARDGPFRDGSVDARRRLRPSRAVRCIPTTFASRARGVRPGAQDDGGTADHCGGPGLAAGGWGSGPTIRSRASQDLTARADHEGIPAIAFTRSAGWPPRPRGTDGSRVRRGPPRLPGWL